MNIAAEQCYQKKSILTCVILFCDIDKNFEQGEVEEAEVMEQDDMDQIVELQSQEQESCDFYKLTPMLSPREEIRELKEAHRETKDKKSRNSNKTKFNYKSD